MEGPRSKVPRVQASSPSWSPREQRAPGPSMCLFRIAQAAAAEAGATCFDLDLKLLSPGPGAYSLQSSDFAALTERGSGLSYSILTSLGRRPLTTPTHREPPLSSPSSCLLPSIIFLIYFSVSINSYFLYFIIGV